MENQKKLTEHNYLIEQKQNNTLKTKVLSLYEETPKQFLNPTLTPKMAHQGPKKLKMTPKSSQNPKLELKELQKIKVAQLHEQTPKQFFNCTQTPKIAHQGPQKIENDPKNSQLGLQNVKNCPKNLVKFKSQN